MITSSKINMLMKLKYSFWWNKVKNVHRKQCFRKIDTCITLGDYTHAPLLQTAVKDTLKYTIHQIFM